MNNHKGGNIFARIRVAVYLSILVFPLGLASALAEEGGRRTLAAHPRSVAPPIVYRSTVTYRSHGRHYRRVEWVSPTTAEWRIAEGARITIYRPGLYVVTDPRTGTYVRRGSTHFIGDLREIPFSLQPVNELWLRTGRSDRTALTRRGESTTYRRGHAVATVRLLARAALTRELAQELFHPHTTAVTGRAVERTPGAAPTLPVTAYWFGTSGFGRSARTSVEYSSVPSPALVNVPGYRRREATAYIMLYEVAAAGDLSSAVPGQPPPEGEIQIISQPLELPLSQAWLSAFNGVNGDLRYKPWPREHIRLKNGEPATVVANYGEGAETTGDGTETHRQFAVITGETLVWVTSGSAGFDRSEMLSIASALEPIRS